MSIIFGTIFDDNGSIPGFPPLNGTGGANTIVGWTGDDELDGEGGADVLYGGEGADIAFGGAGADVIYGDSGSVGFALPGGFFFVPTDGNQNINGPDTENDELYGGGGNDTIYGEDDDDLIRGGAADDKLYGGINDDWVRGDAGNDTVAGNDGDDSVSGGAGNDYVYGDTNLNSLTTGETGSDIVNGGLGNDVLRGDSPSLLPLVNIGFDIFEWTETADIGTSTASNVEVDRILDFNALPTLLDGILGIDHIDLSAILTIDDVDDGDLKIVTNVGGNSGRTQLLIDTNDDSKNAFDLKIDVFSNKGVDWTVGFYGDPTAEIWVGI